MKIVLAGATGFLGRPLVDRLAAHGHELVVLSRRADAAGAARTIEWNPAGPPGPWTAELDGAGAVINLAGESIAGARWTDAHKRRVLESRVAATRSLAAAIRGAAHPPPVFISGSAVGYYGARGDEILTEDSTAGGDFLARVCIQWEAEAGGAAPDTRVVCVRTGVVLERDGGALRQMLLPFRIGIGGPVGSGRQWWPWIHREDWLELVCWALDAPGLSGALNATAPEPVTNRTFARELGRALHRPSFMPTPAFALRLALGEMADALLLSGQRAVPAKAERLGFRFRYPRLAEALTAIFRQR
ncbi:MAG: TIGR01777 family oxidoreductase [Betaproteobacteria bacterium]